MKKCKKITACLMAIMLCLSLINPNALAKSAEKSSNSAGEMSNSVDCPDSVRQYIVNLAASPMFYHEVMPALFDNIDNIDKSWVLDRFTVFGKDAHSGEKINQYGSAYWGNIKDIEKSAKTYLNPDVTLPQDYAYNSEWLRYRNLSYESETGDVYVSPKGEPMRPSWNDFVVTDYDKKGDEYSISGITLVMSIAGLKQPGNDFVYKSGAQVKVFVNEAKVGNEVGTATLRCCENTDKLDGDPYYDWGFEYDVDFSSLADEICTYTLKDNPDGNVANTPGVLGPYYLISAAQGYNAVTFAGGDGSIQNPYQIENAEQLDGVRKKLDAHYILNQDIDLSEIENWQSIGKITGDRYKIGKGFTGSLNGNGHAIKNMKIQSDMGAYEASEIYEGYGATQISRRAGFFGTIGYGGRVENLNFENMQIRTGGKPETTDVQTNIAVGGISGFNAGQIKNCHVYGQIVFDADNTITEAVAGGLVGYQAGQPDSTIATKMDTGVWDSSNQASLEITANESVTAGGIVGSMVVSKGLMNCINKGIISAEITEVEAPTDNSWLFVASGGIAGSAAETSENAFNSIEGCLNTGDVQAIYSEKINRKDSGKIRAVSGGILGLVMSRASNDFSITNCQVASERINIQKRDANYDLSPSDDFSTIARIIASSGRQQGSDSIPILENNTAWEKTKLNGLEVPRDYEEARADGKQGESVKTAKLDEKMRKQTSTFFTGIQEVFNVIKNNLKDMFVLK